MKLIFLLTCPPIFTKHLDIIVHWIFSPSNHGKSECDSHGAVVKCAIARFVLSGILLRNWCPIFSIVNIFSDNNHVDDEYEAAEFINMFVKNSIAFVMEVLPDEKEQDCTAVKGSNKTHEFRYLIFDFSKWCTSFLPSVPGSMVVQELCKFVFFRAAVTFAWLSSSTTV